MAKEYWVLAALAIAGIFIVTALGRPDKPRQTLFLLLVAQAVGWPGTILVVLIGQFENPVRLFPKATDGNVMFAFIFLPAVFVAYYWHYPRNKSRILQIAYTMSIAGVAALVHVALQKYTDLVVYITFSGYEGLLVIGAAYYVLRIYADWYFHLLAKERLKSPR